MLLMLACRVLFHPNRRTGSLRARALLEPTKGWDERRTSAGLTSRCELLGNDEASTSACSRERECPAGEAGRQELLWQQYRLGRILGLDTRPHIKSTRSPDVRHMEPQGEPHLTSVDIIRIGGSEPRSKCFDLPRLKFAEYERSVTADTVSELCQQGELTQAVEALGVLVQTGCRVSRSLFYAVLKHCAVHRQLVLGSRVHALTVKQGGESDTFLCNHILRMYASHARLEDAMNVFAGVAEPDVFMWSSIISAHLKQGQAKQAIQLYNQMCSSSVKPDSHVFVAALQACATATDLRAGQQVHADMLGSGVELGLVVFNSLVDMYAKCGSLADAQRVFDGLDQKDVVTWTALISGYAQQGLARQALQLCRAMQEEGAAEPDPVAFVSLLHVCALVGTPALETGKQLHAQIKERCFQAHVAVGGGLVNMYAKCGSLEDAQHVFDRLQQKNAMTWTALITGYAKCGKLNAAQSLFDMLPQKDVVMWNAMIAGYSQQGRGQEALHLFGAMQEEGMSAPDSVTFVCLLQACATVGTLALEKGKQLHAEIRKRQLQADVSVASSLVNMYAKCGSVEEARGLFDRLGANSTKNVVTWNAMIAGYSQQGMAQEALDLYRSMEADNAVAPNSVTFVCLLQACATLGTTALGEGEQVHAQITDRGLEADTFVASSLINMYAKCGRIQKAQGVFDRLGQKNVVTWTALIAAYSEQRMGQEALRLYSAMCAAGMVAPNSVTFVCLLQACADVAALHLGRQLHAQIKEQRLEADPLVAIGLINMYGKSGSMVDAQQVFDQIPNRMDAAWNSLIAGYTRQGDCEAVFNLFHKMQDAGVQPASITFLSLLTACSHAGLVDKGREHFEAMRRYYSITPTVEHYACMVDLLGRAGYLDESLALARTMPVLPTAAVWHTLLGSCRKWGNVEVGCHAFHEALKLDSKDAVAYVLMSNIYRGAQMWKEAREMQMRRIGIGAWKQPGQSWWTDMDGLVHIFLVGDAKHRESEGIHARLKSLFAEMKGNKTLPHVDSSLGPIAAQRNISTI